MLGIFCKHLVDLTLDHVLKALTMTTGTGEKKGVDREFDIDYNR